MPPLRFRLSTFLLVMALLCVAGGFLVQHREVLRLREALRQEELAAMVRDQRMQKTYGFFLAERGGQYHIPSGEYVFSQGVRAAGGEQWCRFRFAEGFDLEELVETMNLLTPRVFLVSTHDLVKQIEVRADWFIPTAKERETETLSSVTGVRATMIRERSGKHPPFCIEFRGPGAGEE